MKQAPWAFWRTTRRLTLSLWTFASSSPATLSYSWFSWYRVSCTTAGAKIPRRSTPQTLSRLSLPSGWWWCRALRLQWDGGTRLTWSPPTTSQRSRTLRRRRARWSERDLGGLTFVHTWLFFVFFFMHVSFYTSCFFFSLCRDYAWIGPTQEQICTVR